MSCFYAVFRIFAGVPRMDSILLFTLFVKREVRLLFEALWASNLLRFFFGRFAVLGYVGGGLLKKSSPKPPLKTFAAGLVH